MKKHHRWLGALWTWWLLCCLLTVGLWIATTRTGLHTLQQAQTLQLEQWQSGLRAKFAAMDQLRGKLLSNRSAADQPFYTVYQDLASTPVWVHRLMQNQRGDRVLLRPLPPGMQQTRVPEAPASYLVEGQRQSDGRWRVAVLNLAYLHGQWTRDQLPGPELCYQWQSGLQAWGPAQLAHQLPGLLADQPYPFERLDYQLDETVARKAYLRGQAGWLAAALLLLASFGGTVYLAGRGLRREWDFVQARRHFNALVSHELRTPISAIRMYTEILQSGWIDDPGKLSNYHQIIAGEGSRLGNLVENLLGIGSLENGQAQFESVPVDLKGLLGDLTAREKWPVQLDLPEDLPQVLGDREALQLVLGNLIQNALKYGGQPAQVSVHAARRQSRVVVEVLDRGPGIPAALRSTVFEAYQRLPSSGAGGVGLGLALVKGFVAAQGGSVEVSDRDGGGAVFRLYLVPA